MPFIAAETTCGYHNAMMKSKKKMKGKKAKVVKKKSMGKKVKKAAATKGTRMQLAYDDSPLTATEMDRVRESRQNIREGNYRDFATVDDVWKFAESD